VSRPNFGTDLRRGKAGEDFLRFRYPGLCWPPEGERKYDLFDSYNNVTVEVKCDSYDRKATPNFFMEQRTRVAGQPGYLVGGPWRAAEDGVDEFVYLYHHPDRPGESCAYWFDDMPALVGHLNTNLAGYEVRRVRGGRLTAVGVLVPRRTLRHLCTRVIYT
jgi:hypothetical protein